MPWEKGVRGGLFLPLCKLLNSYLENVKLRARERERERERESKMALFSFVFNAIYQAGGVLIS
jgi:hypothetical protein